MNPHSGKIQLALILHLVMNDISSSIYYEVEAVLFLFFLSSKQRVGGLSFEVVLRCWAPFFILFFKFHKLK